MEIRARVGMSWRRSDIICRYYSYSIRVKVLIISDELGEGEGADVCCKWLYSCSLGSLLKLLYDGARSMGINGLERDIDGRLILCTL